jgi:hypothetical protein
MREQMTHPDAGDLAEFRAGLITGRHGARISAHLAACSRCAGLAGDLAELPTLLAAVPAPVMPASVAQRLEAVLAIEVVTSGINYQPGTLRQQVASELQRRAASASSGKLATAQVKGCVLAVTSRAPLLVETARFQGRPAIVIVARSGDHDVAWVTTPSCSGPGRHVLDTTALRGTSAP